VARAAGAVLKFVIDNLPSFFYLAGSLFFVAGTVIALYRVSHGH